MAKMNWSKARKFQDLELIDGVQQPYSKQYFNKLKNKAIEITRKRGIYNFDKFGPKNPINYQLQPKAHVETGIQPENELVMGATDRGEDWDFWTGKGKTGNVKQANAEVAVTRYNGNVADLIKSHIKSRVKD